MIRILRVVGRELGGERPLAGRDRVLEERLGADADGVQAVLSDRSAQDVAHPDGALADDGTGACVDMRRG